MKPSTPSVGGALSAPHHDVDGAIFRAVYRRRPLKHIARSGAMKRALVFAESGWEPLICD